MCSLPTCDPSRHRHPTQRSGRRRTRDGAIDLSAMRVHRSVAARGLTGVGQSPDPCTVASRLLARARSWWPWPSSVAPVWCWGATARLHESRSTFQLRQSPNRTMNARWLSVAQGIREWRNSRFRQPSRPNVSCWGQARSHHRDSGLCWSGGPVGRLSRGKNGSARHRHIRR